MKKIIILILVILIAVLIWAVYFRDAKAPEPEDIIPEGIVDEGNPDAICGRTETIEDVTEDYTMKIEFCRVGVEEVDLAVDTWINERVMYTADNAEKLKELGSAAKPELYASSETFSHSDTIKSLKIAVYEYQGGAHGMTNYMTWVFNREADEIFELESLFQENSNPLQTIYPIVKEKLMAKGEYMEEDWVDRVTGSENTENYKHFVLDGNNLVFTFPAYQVGPYAIGSQEVAILLSELASILKPEFLEPVVESETAE